VSCAEEELVVDNDGAAPLTRSRPVSGVDGEQSKPEIFVFGKRET
jgi:hypothetical protein